MSAELPYHGSGYPQLCGEDRQEEESTGTQQLKGQEPHCGLPVQAELREQGRAGASRRPQPLRRPAAPAQVQLLQQGGAPQRRRAVLGDGGAPLQVQCLQPRKGPQLRAGAAQHPHRIRVSGPYSSQEEHVSAACRQQF